MTAREISTGSGLEVGHHLREQSALPRRIVAVGSSGAGKSTMAAALSHRLGLPHIELDALRHGPNWAEVSDDQFRERLAVRVDEEAWVVDGNYGFSRDLSWSRAELVVWLDYSLPLVMARLLRRTFRRIVTREELWNGNRESLLLALSPDSVVVWALKTFHRRRRQLLELSQRPEYAHLQVLRFRSPADAEEWLSRLPHQTSG